MNDPTPAAIVREAESLESLAKRINDLHEEGENAHCEALERYRDAGEALLKAKALVGHGNWTAWLEANVDFTPQTARAYMRLAKGWDDNAWLHQGLGPSLGNESGFRFGLCEALRLLAEGAEEDDEDGTPRAPRAYLPPDEGPAGEEPTHTTTDDAEDGPEDVAAIEEAAPDPAPVPEAAPEATPTRPKTIKNLTPDQHQEYARQLADAHAVLVRLRKRLRKLYPDEDHRYHTFKPKQLRAAMMTIDNLEQFIDVMKDEWQIEVGDGKCPYVVKKGRGQQ